MSLLTKQKNKLSLSSNIYIWWRFGKFGDASKILRIMSLKIQNEHTCTVARATRSLQTCVLLNTIKSSTIDIKLIAYICSDHILPPYYYNYAFTIKSWWNHLFNIDHGIYPWCYIWVLVPHYPLQKSGKFRNKKVNFKNLKLT